MSQLNYSPANERGSVLVAALAFAIIMGIAGSGLMMLSGHSANMEDEAYKNDLAFQAAESGWQVGKRWLADPANWGTNFNFNTIINGMNVIVVSNAINATNTTLTSTAAGANLSFVKNITNNVELVTSTYPGVFINNLDPINQGGLDNIWFDGPFHSNTPLVIASATNIKRGPIYFLNGPVTVHNDNTPSGFGTLLSGNDYTFGIQCPNGNLDNYFERTFSHSQDIFNFPPLQGAPTAILQQNNSFILRAVLYFYIDPNTGLGRARYYFNNPPQIQDFLIDGQYIFVPNPINVLGIVKGRVTVETAPGCNIFPVGDLIYDAFIKIPGPIGNVPDLENYNNGNEYGLNGNPNFLALVSGGDIKFLKGRQKAVLAANFATGTLTDGPLDGNLYITAALIAAQPNRGIIWETEGNTGNPINLDITQFRYFLRVIGCRTIDRFFNYTLSAGAAANDRFRFYYDPRINNSGFTAPGLTGFRRITTDGNVLFLLKSTWQEQNI